MHPCWLARSLPAAHGLAKQLDGMLVSLHGAAVAEGIDDADAFVLARIRSVLGPDAPIVGTFDFHANLGETVVAGADVLVGYDTFPHVDMADRGREAARILAGLLDESCRPKHALRKVPVLTVPQNQCTDEAPVKAIMEQLRRIEQSEGILCGSVAMGFPYADLPQLGVSILVYADDEARANASADELAVAIWN